MNTDRIRPIDTHSPPGDDRRTRLSKHGKNPTDRRALTSWRRQREALVRTWKESDRMTGTHQLETEKGGTCQDTKGNRQTDADSQTGDGMREALVRTRKESDRRTCTHILETAEGSTCQDGKTQTNRRALTSWRRQREAPVRTRKKTDRSTRTHQLERRGRHLSGHRKKQTDRRALTDWRR